MREDFPTLERPMKAISPSVDSGQESRSGALVMNLAEVIFMIEVSLGHEST
jgi:hypothetical protein